MTTTCEGAWNGAAYIEMEGDLITVPRCSGCGEQFVIVKGRGYPAQGYYPADMTPEECVRAALMDRALG